jgi:hypothetical protein
LEAAARAPDMRKSKAEGGGFDILRRGVSERGNVKLEEVELLTEMRNNNGREKYGLKCNANIN